MKAAPERYFSPFLRLGLLEELAQAAFTLLVDVFSCPLPWVSEEVSLLVS